ncbi:unnamed protein product (macronuclear) [Paramecium tetraurelia]|uniref:EF-hand domain-containing protein n=1 Tax=Paramecium tetraurelia TaxID=5888 RepID=A0BIG7_PARTE|nr:uncharacterized protein GSPATT00004706001 [Paramecium tetraurelia]CAK58334.1 unnamed protein product [Paramecium tetraurelia]|eukprot:XP_001425732.1 hypothetical protein (macronuclear) [Paramecium tetraurelia strain d4-2]
MNQKEIAKEVLAVSLHIADAEKFDFEDSKKRMQLLTESVLKTNLLRQKPNKNCNQTVDLEFQQIDNLKDLLPHLAECSNLRELILHGNRLHTLPEDLSTLSTVETLDISNNLFDNILPIIKALKTMPKLIHLQIGLRNVNEEKYVIQQLPNLITLNNRRLKFFDQLDSERLSEKQSARSEKSCQSEVTFNQEDVDNVENLFNQICNLENTSNQKKTHSPQLADHVKDVMTDFQTKVQQTHSKHFLDTHILKAKFDLYQICFRELIDYFRNNNNKLEQVLKALQQEHSNIFNDLTNVIYNLRDYKKISKETHEIEQLIQESEIVKSQNKEIQLFKEEHDRLLSENNKILQQKDQLYELLQPLQLQVNTLQKEIQKLEQEKENLNNIISQLEYQFAQQQQQLQQSNRDSSKQIQSANQSFQDIQSFSNLQTQQVVMLVKATQTENQQLLEKESQTFNEEENAILTKSIDMQSFQQESEDKSQNDQQQENKKYLETIVRSSKVEKSSNIMSEISYKQTESPSFVERRRQKALSDFHLLVQPQSFRPLTLKQLKEIIQDIYESKQKHDIRQYENRLPLETIEQHMYTYLYYKYGLRNLALEWVACIINAIQRYVTEDNDVAVFGLMLKNNLDEDFRLLQSTRKQKIEHILYIILQAKYKTKPVAEIKEMVKQKVAGYITHQEVVDILKSFLEEEEKDTILNLLKMHQIKTAISVSPIRKVNQIEQQSRPSAQKEPIKYEFSVFIKILLEFFMNLYQQYLANLYVVFESVDHDKDGIINQQQFFKLTESIKPNLKNEECTQIYETLDPFQNDQITFSQIVRVFKNLQLQNKNVDLIQQISVV